jgi:hypothetical protein
MQFLEAGELLSWERVLGLWRSSFEFCETFNEALAAMPYEALFWENPPLQPDHLQQEFECICADSSALAAVHAEPHVFRAALRERRDGSDVATFANLGGDALLVVPACLPGEDPRNYAHLARFVRRAPPAQRREFWRQVGTAVLQQLNGAAVSPLWLSTSGLGVYWLHVRLDSYPKYYTYAPYKSA